MRFSKLISGLSFGALALFLTPAFAAEEAAATAATAGGTDWSSLAAGLGMAIAVLAGTFSQSGAARSALEGIARNPGAAGQMFTPMILGLVFIESLVLFGWVIMAKLVGLF